MRNTTSLTRNSLFRYLMRTGFFIAAFVLIASQAEAHIRWLIKGKQIPDNVHFIFDGMTVVILVCVLLFAISAALIHMYRTNPLLEPMEKMAASYKNIGWRIICILSGVMLIGNVWTGVYLAPNMMFENQIMYWFGVIAQLLIAALLIFQVSFSISGVLIIVGGVVALFAFPFDLVIDYLFEFVLLGVCLIILGPKLTGVDKFLAIKLDWNTDKYQHLPLPLIRIAVGISLIVLALHNKLMDPAISVVFLEEYPVNFINNMGFESFTNLHFVFFAGVLELTLGGLILAGIATRYVAGFLSIFFIVTLIQFGLMELLGHAPLIGIAILLVIMGSGSLKEPERTGLKFESEVGTPREALPQS